MQPTNTPKKPERQSKKARFDLKQVGERTVSRRADKGSFIPTPNGEQSAASPIKRSDKKEEGENARPMTGHAMKDRVEKLKKAARQSKKARLDKDVEIESTTAMTGHPMKDRVEKLLESIRGWRTTRDYATVPVDIGTRRYLDFIRIERLMDSIRGWRAAGYWATVSIGIGVGNPHAFIFHDARIMLPRGYYWSFSAGGSTFGKSTKSPMIKTPKKRINSNTYPWSAGPATVKDYAAVLVGTGAAHTSSANNARILVSQGYYWSFSASGSAFEKRSSPARMTKTPKGLIKSNIEPWSADRTGLQMPHERKTDGSRMPRIFPGFAIGGLPQQATYYPLLPVPPTSRIQAYIKGQEESGRT